MTVFFAEKDARFRAENLEDFVDVDVATCFFCFFCFCLLRSVFLLLFPLKTKVDQANKYDIFNFFVFSNELNPGDCKSPPRRGNNTLTLPELYFY